MKRLLGCADRYIQSRDWTMLAFLKFCLCSIGILLGLSVPGKHKRLPQLALWVYFWPLTSL